MTQARVRSRLPGVATETTVQSATPIVAVPPGRPAIWFKRLRAHVAHFCSLSREADAREDFFERCDYTIAVQAACRPAFVVPIRYAEDRAARGARCLSVVH